MKKLLKPCLAAAGIAFCSVNNVGAIVGASEEAVKCVKLNSATTYTSSYNSYKNQTDWYATGNGVEIHGVAVCAADPGGSVGRQLSALQIKTNAAENKYCWCRMIEPAVSSYWVFPELCTDTTCDIPTATNCLQNCGLYCARSGYKTSQGGSNPLSFRKGLFGSLS